VGVKKLGIATRRGKEGDEVALKEFLESLEKEDEVWMVLRGREQQWIHNLTKDDRIHNRENTGKWLFFAFDDNKMIGHVNGMAWDRAPPDAKQHIETTKAKYNLIGKKAGQVGIAVHRDYRRKGIGLELMKMAIEEAKDFGVEVLAISVNAGNTPMIRLAEKLGFQEHIRERKGEKESILMTLNLT